MLFRLMIMPTLASHSKTVSPGVKKDKNLKQCKESSSRSLEFHPRLIFSTFSVHSLVHSVSLDYSVGCLLFNVSHGSSVKVLNESQYGLEPDRVWHERFNCFRNPVKSHHGSRFVSFSSCVSLMCPPFYSFRFSPWREAMTEWRLSSSHHQEISWNSPDSHQQQQDRESWFSISFLPPFVSRRSVSLRN